MRIITTILLTLIFFSCTKQESFRKESWYKITNTTIVDTVLTDEFYYNLEDKLLLKIRWQTSKKIKSIFSYDDNEKVKEWLAYSDTTMQNRQHCISEYEKGIVVKQTYTFSQKDLDNEIMTLKYINTTDNNDNLTSSLLINEKDTTRVSYTYNKEGLLETHKIIEPSGDVQMTLNNQYDKLNNLIFINAEYPKRQIIANEIYNYQDSILYSKFLINNRDTIRQENYIYDNGIKSEINVIEKEDKYKIIIKTEIVDKIPSANTLDK